MTLVSAKDTDRVIPKKFFVVTPFGEDEASLKASKDIAAGVLNGVQGISDRSEIIMQWYGIARDAIMSMDAEELIRLNSFSRVQYDNPDYLVSNGMAALYRVFNKNKDFKYGPKALANNLKDHVASALKERPMASGLVSNCKQAADALNKASVALESAVDGLPPDPDDRKQVLRETGLYDSDLDYLQKAIRKTEEDCRDFADYAKDGRFNERNVEIYLGGEYSYERWLRELAETMAKADDTVNYVTDYGFDDEVVQSVATLLDALANVQKVFVRVGELRSEATTLLAEQSQFADVGYKAERGGLLTIFEDASEGFPGVKTVKGLAALIQKSAQKDSDLKKLTVAQWEKLLRKGLDNIGKTYKSEGEWLVKDRKLKVPRGSTLWISKYPLPEDVEARRQAGETSNMDDFVHGWAIDGNNAMDRLIKDLNLEQRYTVRRIDKKKFDEARNKWATRSVSGSADEPLPEDDLEAFELWADFDVSDEEREVLKERLKQYKNFVVPMTDEVLNDTFLVDDNVVTLDGDEITIEEKNKWLDGQDHLRDKVIDALEEQFKNEFLEYPSPLYHATPSKSVASIMKNGLKPMAKTRSLSNRGVGAAIFTADDLDYISDSYGDAIFKIDVPAMKQDGVEFSVEKEPAVFEGEAMSALAHLLGIDDYYWESGDSGADDPSTVILHVSSVDPKYLSLVNRHGEVVSSSATELYHTTSLSGLASILKSKELRGHPYVSLSEHAYTGDISFNDVTIVFDAKAFGDSIEKVQYTQDWFDSHGEQASYIAGDGWAEQYEVPEDCFDEEGFEDTDCSDRAYREAEFMSFTHKSREREWISKNRRPLSFPESAVLRVIVHKDNVLSAVEEVLSTHGYAAEAVYTVDAVKAATHVSASTLEEKNGRPKGAFLGDDDGTWEYSTGYPLGHGRNWYASIGLSSANEWKNLSVEGATEWNSGFRSALKEIVKEYPQVLEFTASFDGPAVKVSDLVASEPDLSNLVLLHGTSTAVLPSISKEGLRPRGDTGVPPAYGARQKPSREHLVYLTSQPQMARFAALAAAKVHGGEPVILEVSDIDWSKAEPDEDSREDTAEASLARLGSIGYRGTLRNVRVRGSTSASASAKTKIEKPLSAAAKKKKTDRLFHGSSQLFTEFSNDKIKNSQRGPGIFFSNSEKYASVFGSYVYECAVNLLNPKVYFDSMSFVVDVMRAGDNPATLYTNLREAGHDGIIIEKSKVSTGIVKEVIAFGAGAVKILKINGEDVPNLVSASAGRKTVYHVGNLDAPRKNAETEIEAKYHASSLKYWFNNITEGSPPLELLPSGHVWDGYHRLVAAMARGVDTLPAITINEEGKPEQPVARLMASSAEAPKDFRLMFRLPNKDVPDLGEQLARGVLKGVAGITDSGKVLMLRMLGQNRNAMLVMPGAAVLAANDLERVEYDNPDYLMANDMAVAQRIMGQSHTKQSTIERILREAASFRSPVKDFMTAWGNLDVFPSEQLAEVPLDSALDFATELFALSKPKVEAAMQRNASLGEDFVQERYGPLLDPDNYLKAVNAGLLAFGRSFIWEGEWLVNNKTLRIPDGSRLFIMKEGSLAESAKQTIEQYQLADRYPVRYVDASKMERAGYALGQHAEQLTKERWKLSSKALDISSPVATMPAMSTKKRKVRANVPLSFAEAKDAMADAVEKSASEGIPVALGGGFAMQAYGSDRLTQDVDLIATKLPSFAAEGDDLTFGGKSVDVNGIPIDVIVRADDYADLYEEAVRKAKPKAGYAVKVITPEYLVAMKMVAGRPKDDLDLNYLLSSVKMDMPTLKSVVSRFLGRYAVSDLASRIQEAKWMKKAGKL